mgnify:CR=1 FL=1
MTDMNPKEVFFRFAKSFISDLAGLSFSDGHVEGQEIIAVRGPDGWKPEDGILIDPDYDQLIDSFLNIDYDRWAVNWLYSLVEQAKSRGPEKANELYAQNITDLIIRPLINSNIDSNKVYFMISYGPAWKDLSWADKVIEV